MFDKMPSGQDPEIPLVTTEEVEALQKESAALGSRVEACVTTDGWKIWLAIIQRKINQVRNKDDYKEHEFGDWRSDRKACTILQEALNEFHGFVEDGQAALNILEELKPGTAPASLSLEPKGDGETREV